jgi:two-component system, response regulator
LNSPFHILVADDDKHDHFFISRAFNTARPDHKVTSVFDGEELMDYLCKKGKFNKTEESLPNVILLDINMPRLDGFETLKELKKVNTLGSIPVFVWSTDYSDENIAKAIKLGAMGFLAKNLGYEEIAGRLLKICK